MSQPLVCPTCDALRQSLARIWAERDAALAECTRLADVNADLQASVHRYAGYADTHRAECERLRTIVRWAREFVAQEESAMGDVNDGTHAYQQLRTALDAGEPLPNVGTPADVPTKAENVGRVALDAGENDNGA